MLCTVLVSSEIKCIGNTQVQDLNISINSTVNAGNNHVGFLFIFILRFCHIMRGMWFGFTDGPLTKQNSLTLLQTMFTDEFSRKRALLFLKVCMGWVIKWPRLEKWLLYSVEIWLWFGFCSKSHKQNSHSVASWHINFQFNIWIQSSPSSQLSKAHIQCGVVLCHSLGTPTPLQSALHIAVVIYWGATGKSLHVPADRSNPSTIRVGLCLLFEFKGGGITGFDHFTFGLIIKLYTYSWGHSMFTAFKHRHNTSKIMGNDI